MIILNFSKWLTILFKQFLKVKFTSYYDLLNVETKLKFIFYCILSKEKTLQKKRNLFKEKREGRI